MDLATLRARDPYKPQNEERVAEHLSAEKNVRSVADAHQELMHLETPGGAIETRGRIGHGIIDRGWNWLTFGLDSEDQKVYDISPEIYGETAAEVLAETRDKIDSSPPTFSATRKSLAEVLTGKLDAFVGGDSTAMTPEELDAMVAENPQGFLDLLADDADDRLQENHANKYVLNPRIAEVERELLEKEVKYGETRAWYMKTADYLQEPYNLAKLALEVTVTRGSLSAARVAQVGGSAAIGYQVTKDVLAAAAIETADAMRLVDSGVITQEEANIRIALATGITSAVSVPISGYQGHRAINILAKQRGAEQVTDKFITENLKKIKEANESLGKQIEAEAGAISETQKVLDPKGVFTKEIAAVKDMLYRIQNKLCKLF